MWNSIQNEPYVRPMIPDPDDVVNINGTVKQILEPLSKMTKGNKKQYIADVKVMNYLLQAIPNDIYNLVDACNNAKEMWERIKSKRRRIVRISLLEVIPSSKETKFKCLRILKSKLEEKKRTQG
ncbi:hypothetical protein Tco_0942997 [Tanacetum coccineum]